MNLAEAIKTALSYEAQVHKTYLEAAMRRSITLTISRNASANGKTPER
jgi:hypothetical protein